MTETHHSAHVVALLTVCCRVVLQTASQCLCMPAAGALPAEHAFWKASAGQNAITASVLQPYLRMNPDCRTASTIGPRCCTASGFTMPRVLPQAEPSSGHSMTVFVLFCMETFWHLHIHRSELSHQCTNAWGTFELQKFRSMQAFSDEMQRA